MRDDVKLLRAVFVELGWQVFGVCSFFFFGLITRGRGLKALLYDSGDVQQARVTLARTEVGQLWIEYDRPPRWTNDDGHCLRVVHVADRDITWCLGWTGRNADAFKAMVTMADDRAA